MILFLYGEDTFRSREKLRQIREKHRESDKQSLNLAVFGEELDFAKFREAVSQAAFLAKVRLVIVESVFGNKKETQRRIVEFLKKGKVPDSTILVFWERGVPDQRSLLFKTLVNLTKSEEFKALFPWQLEGWVRKEVKKREGVISSEATRELIVRTGNDLAQISNEIDKLLGYAGRGRIRLEAVQKLVRAKLETDIFKLVDALSRKDRNQALKFIQDQISSGAEELYLLTMIVYAFRNLILVSDLKNKGFSQNAIIRESGLHPFVVKKTLFFSPGFQLSDLKKIYLKLLDLDTKIKTGALSADFALSMLVFGVTG